MLHLSKGVSEAPRCLQKFLLVKNYKYIFLNLNTYMHISQKPWNKNIKKNILYNYKQLLAVVIYTFNLNAQKAI